MSRFWTILSFFSFCAIAFSATTYCSDRGSCNCDCSWASSSSCKKDDGSCCFSCCCGSTPSPTPTSLSLYCPAVKDLASPYGSPTLYNQGWSIHAGAAAATKSAFNLLGGYVEYDVDFSGVRTGVNANIYTISPYISSSGFTQSNYCDGAATGSKWCPEVDWIESNGNCGAQTTLHTKEGTGNNGCTAWGCANSYYYKGRSSFHMKISYAADGTWTTLHDGVTIYPSNLSPTPGSSDWSTLSSTYASKGAVIYSSQWVGWVPLSDCGSSGDLYSSTFTIKNLKIYGKVVQGPTPTLCSQLYANETMV